MKQGFWKGLTLGMLAAGLAGCVESVSGDGGATTREISFGIATDEQIATIREMALKINAVLKDFLATRKVRLIDFKTEYGVDKDGNIILADEITPDCARLWDWDTNEKLDKDRFRRDMGGVEEAYHEIIRRLTGEGK